MKWDEKTAERNFLSAEMILDNFFGMLKKCSFENLTRDYRTTKYMNNALAMPSRMPAIT